MDKRYQIFISSTFKDLEAERASITRSILDMGHIPAGMELFPASPSTQLDYIKRIIDDCDYYILVVGGKYGSTDSSGLSYTEQEFDYAISKDVPVLAFVHSDTGKLRSENVELNPSNRGMLEKFKSKVLANRIVKFWDSLEDLQSKVIVSLTSEFRETPRTGWRRDDGAVSAEVQERIGKVQSLKDFWYGQYSETVEKLKEYEALENAEIEVRYISQNTPRSTAVKAGLLIKEFAFKLQTGLDRKEIEDGLYSLISHHFDEAVDKINPASTNNVVLFLEVFELAKKEGQNYFVSKGKKWLLKAAFMPFEKLVAETSGYGNGYIDDDEIPF